MRTKTIELYTFGELSKESQEKAIKNTISLDGFFDYDWYEYIYEDFKREQLRDGVEVDNIYFSGFYCQGDGACFTGIVNLAEYIKTNKLGNKYRKLLNFIKGYGDSVKITQSGRYSHANTMNLEIDLSYTDFSYNDKRTTKDIDELCDQANELEKIILEDMRNRANKLYKDLQTEYEYLLSDESIAEFLTANEYEFNKEGDLKNE